MNVIVSNKRKEVLDNANIDAIKVLNGLFSVDDLINNFKNYFYSKMVIDATSVVEFANPNVLKKLVNGISAEKLIILLPERPVPPKRFLSLLISLGIYNFSSSIDDVIKYIEKPNTQDEALNYLNSDEFFDVVNTTENIASDLEVENKYILGIKNVTLHAGTTSLIYMLKKTLEFNYKKDVMAIEINTNDFSYFQDKDMISVSPNRLEDNIKNSNADIILIDLNNNNYEKICTEVLYLIEPSIIKINKLMASNRKAFENLKFKNVILNKTLLSSTDIEILSHEAGIPFYFVLPPINDRIGNSILESLINKLNINVDEGKSGFLGLFNKNS